MSARSIKEENITKLVVFKTLFLFQALSRDFCFRRRRAERLRDRAQAIYMVRSRCISITMRTSKTLKEWTGGHLSMKSLGSNSDRDKTIWVSACLFRQSKKLMPNVR